MWAQGNLIPKPMHSRQIVIAEIGGSQWYANDMKIFSRKHTEEKPGLCYLNISFYPLPSTSRFFAKHLSSIFICCFLLHPISRPSIFLLQNLLASSVHHITSPGLLPACKAPPSLSSGTKHSAQWADLLVKAIHIRVSVYVIQKQPSRKCWKPKDMFL